MLASFFTIRSIRARFLLLTTLLVLILFGGLGTFIAYQNSSELRKSLDSKAGSVADLASLTGTEYMANFNFMGLDNLVLDILKDPEVSFAGFYNEKKELVTKSPVPAAASSLKVVERELKSADSSAALGTLKIGYRTDSISRTLRKSALLVAAGTLLTILLFSAGISFAADRIILQPIKRLSTIIEHVSVGDLSQQLEIISNDELGDLTVALNGMIGNLNNMVSQVNGAADELNSITGNLLSASGKVVDAARLQSEGVSSTSSAVTEINASIKGVNESVAGLSISATESASSILEMTSSVEEVAQNTETLAQSVAEVSSSVNQMVASIKQIDLSVRSLMEAANSTSSSVMEMDYSIKQVEQNTADASQISQSVREDAEIGRAALEESIAGIHEIKRSSEITFETITSLSGKTADIGAMLSVIDDVAEQTNLLALNAAIIAAQAGEHGKGFAVVADEIKELAERTRNSTREITRVINGLQDETARAVSAIQSAEKSIINGERLADRSGTAFNKIFAGIQKATDQMKEIAKATMEQGKGSQQIREAVNQVSHMVSQIDTATREQALGSDLIITSTEKMKDITTQVRTAAQEQSKVGKFITASTESITGMINQIRRACLEQAKGSEMIATSVESIESSASINLDATKMMDDSVAKLFEQIDKLKKEMQSFRT
jgi:methyl-accepting chemotaxis protein